jgi:cytochrome c5
MLTRFNQQRNEMIIKQPSNQQQTINNKPVSANNEQQASHMGLSGLGKLTWSALGLSAALALSACSGGDNTAVEDTAAVAETETTVAEVEEPATEVEVVEVVAPEVDPAAPVEVIEVPADETAATEAAAEPEILAADAGAQLYEKQCKACHATGLLAAPILGDKAAWAPRIAKGKDTLHMHSAQGFNKMNAQVNADVSEAQVYAAVDYMIAAAS